ncbi:hypothetical protein M422DRAFT_272641 [Sphaerobolus stellatus SS14]|uniref:Unplaced genomic scaffold SPHSTscaffold_300, whole genome shotgun sequence n=1 Tax=Sphaerobolus stellatus (strain SS14) TaxID=990650 RepID=A0A0C9UB32_SPHS4|nr:hypothetical protein M422DRAFT_272641 [Sphaerobolus stellatus SS14]
MITPNHQYDLVGVITTLTNGKIIPEDFNISQVIRNTLEGASQLSQDHLPYIHDGWPFSNIIPTRLPVPPVPMPELDYPVPVPAPQSADSQAYLPLSPGTAVIASQHQTLKQSLKATEHPPHSSILSLSSLIHPEVVTGIKTESSWIKYGSLP